MRRTRTVPVAGAPALLVTPPSPADPFVVIADLHLGLGAQTGWADGPADGSAPALYERLTEVLEATRVHAVVIAGDVKHPIVGTPPGLRRIVHRFFADLLAAGVAVEIVLGNHDPGLAPHLPREVRVHPASGIVRNGVGIFHGHRWPGSEVLAAPVLVAGHLHPGFRFAPIADSVESKRRCWVRARFPPRLRTRRPRPGDRRFDARDLLVLPPFNPLAGTEALNRTRPSRGRSFLFSRFLLHGESRLYLLDGTDLGRLTIPPPPAATPAPGAAPSGR